MEGWIKLHRRIMDNPLWNGDPFSRGQAWVDMILLANHKPGYFYVRGNKVPVKRGQIGWSIAKLSQRWKWSKGKTKRFLNDLENEQQIEQQKNNVTSIITIVKYDDYQDSDTAEVTAGRTADSPQTVRRQVANKNDKNVKNEKKGEDSQSSSSQPPLHSIPKDQREQIISEALDRIDLTDRQKDMYISKIGASNYCIPRGKKMVPLTQESVVADAKWNLEKGYLNSNNNKGVFDGGTW
jgi:hypothetical protein